MKKLFSEPFGLFVLAIVLLGSVALLLPMEISAIEILGLCVALIAIVGGFSWYFHFTSSDVKRAQSPPGPHPPGETENGTPNEP